MKVIKKDDGSFEVESSKGDGKVYQITPKEYECNCLDYLYRKEKEGMDCKHITRVKSVLKSDDYNIPF